MERVSGPLADVLTDGFGAEHVLQDLEEAGAFVVALDPGRKWFRYHRLFADLLSRTAAHRASDYIAVACQGGPLVRRHGQALEAIGAEAVQRARDLGLLAPSRR